MHDKGSLGFNWLLVIHFSIFYCRWQKERKNSFDHVKIILYDNKTQWMIS